MVAMRGEASFEARGTTYSLVMDLAAFAEAEELADTDIDDLLRRITRIKNLRALLYGGLVAKHPEVSPAMAMELLAEVPGIGEIIVKAVRGAMPQDNPSAEGKAPAPRGTGTKRKPTGPRKA